jgi:hypothetical protein
LWNIVRSETGGRSNDNGQHLLNIDGKLTKNNRTIATSFNAYFSKIVYNLIASSVITMEL